MTIIDDFSHFLLILIGPAYQEVTGKLLLGLMMLSDCERNLLVI
jgi:hypothetical protein